MKILVIGDVGLDSYVKKQELYIGGCAFNVYQSLSNSDKALLCPLGNDEYSEKIRLKLSVDKSIYLPFFSCLPSKQEIDLHPSGEKDFLHFYPGPWGKWRVSKEDLKFIDNFDLCHTVLYEQNLDAVSSYVQSGNWSMDFMTMRDFNEDVTIVKKFLPYLSYAFFGLDESQKLLHQELVGLFKGTEAELIITLGAKGSCVYTKGESFTNQAIAVNKVVDTTGAGDAYIGAYLSAKALNKSILEAMNLASIRSAEVIGRVSLGEKFRLI